MVEKAQSGKSHDHAVFVACLNNGIIAHRTAGLSNIGNAAAESTLDIIAEREERIACKCGFAEPAQPFPLLFLCHRLGAAGEEILPISVVKHVSAFILV